jgi:uncharacterized protein YbjT (DUF2867 family)
MIVITTPTGNIGKQVLADVLKSSESVRVIVRDASKLDAESRQRVEVIEGSHGDLATVNRAFEGAESVFWVVPPDMQASDVTAAYVDFTKPAAEAFKTQGVRRVVGVSALGRGWPKPAGLVSASLAMDDLIASTGVSYRALTNPSFMENLINQAGAIKNQGMFFSPLVGDRKFPITSTRDIATTATKLLLDRSWSGVGHRAVLGPEDLSFNDMAQILSEVLGKPVKFQQIPMEGFKERLAGFGASAAIQQAYVEMFIAKNEGMDNAEPRTTDNTTPTSFRQWAEEVLKPVVLK